MPEKQQIILTDHNELAQAVEGIESGKIIEVVDHHRFGGLQQAILSLSTFVQLVVLVQS